MTLATRLVAVLALALAAPAARADLKIGYVDLQRAIKETEEGKAAFNALQKDFQDKQKLLNQRSDEIKKMQEEFQKQSLLMTPEAKAARGAEIERKMMETQEFYVKMQQEFSGKEREATRPLEEKLQATVREIAEAEGVSVVLAREVIIYAPASLDLTNELVRRYNSKFPLAAKKADAPAKKPDAPAPAKK